MIVVITDCNKLPEYCADCDRLEGLICREKGLEVFGGAAQIGRPTWCPMKVAKWCKTYASKKPEQTAVTVVSSYSFEVEND